MGREALSATGMSWRRIAGQVLLAVVMLAPAAPALAAEACCFEEGLCLDLEPAACTAVLGSPLGAGSACATATCARLTGACCTLFVGSTCTVDDRADCRALDGGFLGAGTVCWSSDCAVPRACCLPDGTCEDGTPSTCGYLGGVVGGPGSTCAASTCVPFEACCLPGGAACLDLAPVACLAAGGTPQGSGVTCASAPCTLAPVACCYEDGACAELDAQACAIGLGIPRGLGSTCATVTCPVLVGACCLPTPFGVSCRSHGEAACIEAGGTFLGQGTACSAVDCDAARACCLPDGACAELVTAECLAASGTPLAHGTTCATVTCPPAARPGRVPDGAARPGVPLRARKGPSTPFIEISWGPSCSGGASGYAIYEGAIARPWYTHEALTCDLGDVTRAVISPGSATAGRYYLVVPVTARAEGSYGVDSSGNERPPAGLAPCRLAQDVGCP